MYMALLRKAVIKQEVEIIVSIVFDVMLDSEIFYNYLSFFLLFKYLY